MYSSRSFFFLVNVVTKYTLYRRKLDIMIYRWWKRCTARNKSVIGEQSSGNGPYKIQFKEVLVCSATVVEPLSDELRNVINSLTTWLESESDLLHRKA